MQDPYDSYGVGETEVAIEGFVGCLVQLHPDLHPVRTSGAVSKRVRGTATDTDKDEEYWPGFMRPRPFFSRRTHDPPTMYQAGLF